MMKKLGIVLMAAFFSVSVAGLSFADEKKPEAAPAATGAPTNPCAGKEMKEKPKKAKKTAGKKVAAPKVEEAPAAAPAPAHTPRKTMRMRKETGVAATPAPAVASEPTKK